MIWVWVVRVKFICQQTLDFCEPLEKMMREFIRYTTEEAIRKAFIEDPWAVKNVLKAEDGDELTFNITYTFGNVPAKYAKAILKEYLAEKL